MTQILNKHDNTEELLKKFPIEHATKTYTEFEAEIQNRILTGFENWNGGMEAWMEWGKILYRDDSKYSVHDIHFTLKEYQMVSAMAFKANNIMMGAFHHMIVCDNWVAINYDTTNENKATGVKTPASVTEFVRFRQDPVDKAVVDEGWGGIRGNDYSAISRVLNKEEAEFQNKYENEIINYSLPNTTELNKKYLVKFPTTSHSDIEKEMKEVILKYIDTINNDGDVSNLLSDNLKAKVNDVDYDKQGFLNLIKERNLTEKFTYKFFQNLMFHTDWVAYKAQVARKQDGKDPIAQSEMTFAHFTKENDKYLIDSFTMKY